MTRAKMTREEKINFTKVRKKEENNKMGKNKKRKITKENNTKREVKKGGNDKRRKITFETEEKRYRYGAKVGKP